MAAARAERRAGGLAHRLRVLAILPTLLLVILVLRGGETPPERASAPAAWRHPIRNGTRIVYPPAANVALTLPDGGRRPIHSLLDIRRPIRFGDWVWNEARVPAGPVWLRVDLARQTISAFRAGDEIGTAVILYGTDGKPTPTGLFPILQRARDHRSTLYDAEMPFMLRLTGDGVAIHASDVRRGRATHGCIGVPPAFAARLFAATQRGDLVAILPPRRAAATA